MLSLLNDRFFFEDPFAHVNRIFRAFDHLDRADSWANVKEEKEHYTLTAPLPGLTEKDLDISATDRALTIKTSLREPVPTNSTETPKENRWVAVWQERPRYQLARTINFPGRIDADKISATLKNGILTVSIPKASAQASRQITVQAG